MTKQELLKRLDGMIDGAEAMSREEIVTRLGDLAYLNVAEPQELMKKANGIPAFVCCYIKVCLVGGNLSAEWDKWAAAGVIGSHAELEAFERADLLIPCDGCGGVKHMPNGNGYRAHHRGTFSIAEGFGFNFMYGDCCLEFDAAHAPSKTVATLAARWKDRSLAAQGMIQ